MCLKIINECRVRGIHCDASYQIGLPNESIDDIKRSIDWIFKHGIERNTFYSITAIWPGTELAKKYGVIADYYEPSYDKKDFEARSGLFFYEQGNPVTTHTTSLVPFIITDQKIKLKDGGSLVNVAPTILEYMDIALPKEMQETESLLQKEEN